jgi:hypothetical protein
MMVDGIKMQNPLTNKTVQIETNSWHFGGTFQPKQTDHVVFRASI